MQSNHDFLPLYDDGEMNVEWPTDLRAERNVLACCLVRDTDIYEVGHLVKAEDFRLEGHRILWECLLDFYEKGKSPNYITICEWLEEHGSLELVTDGKGYAGAAYITGLMRWFLPGTLVGEAAEIVMKLATLRALMKGGFQIFEMAQRRDPEAPVKAEQIVGDAIARRKINQVAGASDLVTTFLQRMEATLKAREAGQPRGLPLPFMEINRQIGGGLLGGDLSILAAKTSVGKTSCALTIAQHAARQGYKVLIFSAEMSKESLTERIIADMAMVDSQRLRSGDLREWWDEQGVKHDEWEAVINASGELASWPLYIDDTSAISTLELRSKARRLQNLVGVDLVIVDYLQLLKSGLDYKNNRTLEVGQIVRDLKALARELNVPVLALAQVNRQGAMSEVLQLWHLKETSDLEQTADNVFLLYVEGSENNLALRQRNLPYVVIWDTAKQRNGPVGPQPLEFIPRLTRFRDNPNLRVSVLAQAGAGDDEEGKPKPSDEGEGEGFQ